jgi:carboxylate-amine ligase
VDEHALDLQALDASNLIRESLFAGNDAGWLRALHRDGEPLSGVVEAAAMRWMGREAAPARG